MGQSLEWYFLDGGGKKDNRDERPWKCMRHAEVSILTEALTKVDYEVAALKTVKMPHNWKNSRQEEKADTYTMDLLTCVQQNDGACKTQRPIRALAINAHSQQ